MANAEIHDGRAFISEGNVVRFSEELAWPFTNNFRVPEWAGSVAAMVSRGDHLMIYCESGVFEMTGMQPLSFCLRVIEGMPDEEREVPITPSEFQEKRKSYEARLREEIGRDFFADGDTTNA